MGDDILKRAKSLDKKIKTSEIDGIDVNEICLCFGLLVAECERLRGELRDTDERASWHMEEENWLRGELARLQKIAIEETARRLYPFNMPIWGNLPEEDFEKLMFYGTERLHGKRYYREQAARELGIESTECKHEYQIASKDSVHCGRCGKAMEFREITGRFGISNHIVETNELVLTSKQRAALELAIERLREEGWDDSADMVRQLLSQSRPGWQATDERKIALRQIELFLTGSRPNDLHWDLRAIAILKDMLDEVKE